MSLTDEIQTISTTSSTQYYFYPDFFPDKDRQDNDDDVVFYVDSMLGEEDNLTRRYDDEFYLDVDEDDVRARDMERVDFERATTSHWSSTTPSTSRSTLSVAETSSSIATSRQTDTVADSVSTAVGTTHQQSSSVSSSTSTLTTTSTTDSSALDDDDWWQQFPFLGSTTTRMTSSVNSMMATTPARSTTEVASFNTMTSVNPPVSTVSDDLLGTTPTTSQLLSTWIFTPAAPARRTTNSYLKHGYIDLDDLDDQEFDVVVGQSGTDEGPKPGGGQVTTSTGIVLLVSIVVASLLLLAVIVLLVFYRYDHTFLPTTSVDSFPAGCRRYLTACGLGTSAVTRSPTVGTTPPPPNATSTGVDDRQTTSTCPSKSHRLPAGTVVVTSTQLHRTRVANNQGVIEWYV